MNNIKFINPKGLLNAINKCNEGLYGNISSTDFEIEYEDISPLDGYTKPVNEETGEQFPNCSPWLKNTYEEAIEWFASFPNCCPYHKKLKGQAWFNRENYKDIAIRVVSQLSYTEHCISKNINKPDWYDAITEYIDWNKQSFGQLPDGYGEPVGLKIYFSSLIDYMQKATKKIPKEKSKRLVEFCINYYNTIVTPQTDINILNATYQKWLKTFPFEISFFNPLKQYFKNQLPILTEKPKVNRYTNNAKAKIHTKDSLIEVLLNLTNRLVTEINSLSLYNDGSLTEPQKIKLELILNERTLKINKGYYRKSPDESQRYRKILKDWFKDEKKFINEIIPVLKELSTHNNASKAEQPKIIKGVKINEIALIYLYEGCQITRINGNDIVAKYGYKSGEKLFQRYTYYSSSANRKGKPSPCTPKRLNNKINLFKNVLEHLSDKAKPRALDEIKILESLSETDY